MVGFHFPAWLQPRYAKYVPEKQRHKAHHVWKVIYVDMCKHILNQAMETLTDYQEVKIMANKDRVFSFSPVVMLVNLVYQISSISNITGTVSSPTKLPVIWDTGSDQSIKSAFWDTHSLPWWYWILFALFGSSFPFFQAIASTHEIWNENTLHQDLVCQCFVQVGGWAGNLLPKALKLLIGVSFGYRFGIVFSPWPSRKKFCTYVSLQQPMPQEEIDNKKYTYQI